MTKQTKAKQNTQTIKDKEITRQKNISKGVSFLRNNGFVGNQYQLR